MRSCEIPSANASGSGFEPEHRFDTPDFSYVPLLREEVNRLPEHYRMPLVLCYFEGKTNQEAAGELTGRSGQSRGGSPGPGRRYAIG